MTSCLFRRTKYSLAQDQDRTGDPVLTKDVLYQLSYLGKSFSIKAGNGTRTRDRRLGRPTLYQLSYSRINGQGRIRTSEAFPQRVYSPPHLATLVPAQSITQQPIAIGPAYKIIAH